MPVGGDVLKGALHPFRPVPVLRGQRPAAASAAPVPLYHLPRQLVARLWLPGRPVPNECSKTRPRAVTSRAPFSDSSHKRPRPCGDRDQ